MLHLTQDFAADFDALTAGLLPGYSGPPYAFTRYADGELALMAGRRHEAQSDHWRWPGGIHPLGEPLRSSLFCSLPGWHIGISCPCHQADDHRKLLYMMEAAAFEYRADPQIDRLTFATLFNGDNYYRFRDLPLNFHDGSLCVISSSTDTPPEFAVPRNGIDPPWCAWRPIVDALMDVRRPIVVAAGPLANCIIHDYWRRMADRKFEGAQVIVDIGSAADVILRGRRTRWHQHPHRENARQKCVWPTEKTSP